MRFAEQLLIAPVRPQLGEAASSSAGHLTSSQRTTSDAILQSLRPGSVVLFAADSGTGRTTVLRHVARESGGLLLGMREFMDRLSVRRFNAIEQTLIEIIEEALEASDLVLVDDLHLITAITACERYPFGGLLNAALEPLLTAAVAAGRQLVFAVNAFEFAPDPVSRRAEYVELAKLGPEDYAVICRAGLGATVDHVSFEDLHRFAPALDGHDLRNASAALAGSRHLSTDDLRGYLEKQQLVSNVDLAEVEAVDWNALKGMDDVIEALEAKIALPFENAPLAADLKLKPKRGVLLSGPPGTGKTTIGRALAHRLKGKFFLIDGTDNADQWSFNCKVEGVFEQAKRNAPAVVFIDDADVIFASERHGFYRYLLTVMDGIESTSASRVCVIITAMEPACVPRALIRSGRIELWLETRLPDEAARLEILRERLAGLPEPFASADLRPIAAAGRNLTGADLKGVVEDAKLLAARDQAMDRERRPIESYFYDAIETVRANHRRYRRGNVARSPEAVPVGFAGH